MRTIRTLTPESVGENPNRFRARCQTCAWSTIWAKFAESLDSVASGHVYESGHTVVIEDRMGNRSVNEEAKP